MNWIMLSLFSLISNFLAILLIRKLTKRIKSEIATMYLFSFVALFLLIYNIFSKKFFSFEFQTLIPMVIVGITGGITYLLLYKSLSIAPNTGYPVAIFSISTVLVTFISAFILGTDLSYIKLFGVITAVSGMILLSLSK